MKFNFFGKKFDVPPVDKKKALTGAGVFMAGMAAGMSDNKLPEIPKGPLDAEGSVHKKEFQTTYDKRAEVEAAFDLSKTNLEGGDGDDEMTPDDFSFEQIDSIPDADMKYGYKQMGTRKLVGAERAYFGSEKTSEKGPFSATRGPNDPIYTLGHVFPGMTDAALFENYGPDGTAHLVELPADIKVFKKKGKVYAVVCGNLLNLRMAPEEQAPEADPQLARAKKPENKAEVKESNLTAKMSEKFNWFLVNPVTKNRQVVAMSVEFEVINNGDKVVNTIGPLYLVKQVDANGKTFWEKVDGAQAFAQYYPIEDIVQERRAYRDHGISPSDYTVPIPKDLRGDALEEYVAQELLNIEVEDFDK